MPNNISKKQSGGTQQHPTIFSQSCQTRNCTVFKFISQLCICGGIFPRNCTIAKITPIYNSGTEDEINIYPSLSILNCFSKIMKKILFVRLNSFLKKHNVYYTKINAVFEATFPHHMRYWTLSPYPMITLMIIPTRD